MSKKNRRHQRHLVDSRTFIELVSPAAVSSEPGKLSTCRTQKVSQGGLQISLKEQVTPGVILQIGVDFPGEADTLHLAGEVRWCGINPDSQFPWVAGFELLNDKTSDLIRWQKLLTAMDG